MKQQTKIYLVALTTILAVGAGWSIYHTSQKPPSLMELRAAPDKFHLHDYPHKAALHTRLSSLFPRGTTKDNIDKYFADTRWTKIQNPAHNCSFSVDIETMRFIYTSSDHTLRAIQITEGNGLSYWPDYQEHCTTAPSTLTPDLSSNGLYGTKTQDPIHLPLMSLDIDENNSE